MVERSVLHEIITFELHCRDRPLKLFARSQSKEMIAENERE